MSQFLNGGWLVSSHYSPFYQYRTGTIIPRAPPLPTGPRLQAVDWRRLEGANEGEHYFVFGHDMSHADANAIRIGLSPRAGGTCTT